MLTKTQKIKLVDDLSKILRDSPNILFVDFTGLKMGEISDLKKELKKERIGFKALKKSLLEFAFSKSGKESFSAQGAAPAGGQGSASRSGSEDPSGSRTTGGDRSFDLSWHKSSVAIVYGSAEPNVMAKILHSFSVKSKKLAILGGFLIGEKMMNDKVVMLAKLPTKEVLIAQFLQILMLPISGFARVLDGIAKKEIRS